MSAAPPSTALDDTLRRDLLALCRAQRAARADSKALRAIDEAIVAITEAMRIRAIHWAMPWRPLVVKEPHS